MLMRISSSAALWAFDDWQRPCEEDRRDGLIDVFRWRAQHALAPCVSRGDWRAMERFAARGHGTFATAAAVSGAAIAGVGGRRWRSLMQKIASGGDVALAVGVGEEAKVGMR